METRQKSSAWWTTPIFEVELTDPDNPTRVDANALRLQPRRVAAAGGRNANRQPRSGRRTAPTSPNGTWGPSSAATRSWSALGHQSSRPRSIAFSPRISTRQIPSRSSSVLISTMQDSTSPEVKSSP